MRFVMVSPTGVGGVKCVRRAAAAAAFERSPLDSRPFTKALVAARDADALGGGARWTCIAMRQRRVALVRLDELTGFEAARLRLPNMVN